MESQGAGARKQIKKTFPMIKVTFDTNTFDKAARPRVP